METIRGFLETLYNSPHYSFGWIIAACLSILPALVSANLVQYYLGKLKHGEIKLANASKLLLFNISILISCISIMSYAFYLYAWT